MGCIIPADLTNGVESNLYNKLLEIYDGNESKAEESYSYFRTPKFLEEVFGNYADAIENQTVPEEMLGRLDEQTFEPELFYDSSLSKYYFKDIGNDKVYYPYDAQGLLASFTTNEIKEFAKSLAYTYYDENLTFNLDTIEFENTTGVSLTKFVESFIEKVGEDLLYNSTDPVQASLGGSLLDSTNNLKEWENEIESIYNSFKLNVVQEEDSEDAHIESREEESRDDLIRIESNLVDHKQNVSNNIKLYLSLVRREETNMFGLNKFVEFGDIYTSLNKTLADLTSAIDDNGNPEDLFEIYKEKIGELGETKSYFKGLYKALDKELGKKEVFRNQIVSAFRLSYNNYLGSEAHRDGDTLSYVTKNLSEVSSRRANLLKQWQFNFQKKFYDKKEKKYINPEGTVRTGYNKFRASKKGIDTIDKLMPFINQLEKDLAHLGATLHTAGRLSDRDTDRQHEVNKGLLFFLDDLNLTGSSLEEKKDKISEMYVNALRGLEAFDKGNVTNIFTDQNVFKNLAEAEAFFQEEGSDASIYTVGKTKWVYSLPSYLSEKVNAWKKHPRLLFQHFKATPYNQGSYYMRYLLGIEAVEDIDQLTESDWQANYGTEAKKRLEDMSLNIFNSAQNKGDATHAKDSKEIGGLDSVVDYMNKVLAFRKKGKVYHKTAIAADKSTEYQLHYGNAVSVKSGVSRYDAFANQYNFSTQTMDILYRYFKSEYERMTKEFDNIENKPESEHISNYHTGIKNALKSQLFPSFSVRFEIDPDTGEKMVILPEDTDLHSLYDPKTGKAHLDNLDAHKDIIIDKIKTIFSNNINDVHAEMVSDGVFVTNEKGELTNAGLDTQVYDVYKKDEQYDGMATKTIVADLITNSIISQVEYSKMFTGDTAYYKNMVDYKKRVPASYTDGLYLNITDRAERYFNVAVIDSVEVPAPYLEKLSELVGEKGLKQEDQEITNYYRNINAADAQAWITPQRWEFIRKKLGKWSTQDEALFTKMMDPNAELSPAELKRAAQPLKGVYFDIVNGAPRYLKYSQAVLLPKLIKDTPLQRMYDKMVLDKNGKIKPFKDQIHEVITKDGMKVGAEGVTTAHDPETGDLLDSFELNSFKLSNAGWKLQQDLSPKGFKSTELGSQIMKIIFQGLAHNQDKNFVVGDTTMTGSELIDHIHDIVNNLSDRGLQQVMKKIGVNPDTFNIENEDRMYSAMIQDLSQRRDTADNTLKALKAGTSPYGIPGQFQIFQNVFSSAINKAAVKVRTYGGSFIQMADFGISKTEAKKGSYGIRFAPWFEDKQSKLHTPEKYTDTEGRERVRPGGVFISGSLIAKYVPNYRELSDEQLFGTLNPKTGKYENGLIDEKILKNIVGYRIPNQGLPSNDAFHVMGLLPEDAADTVIAYTGITTKTGSDFDIDKMYLMVPSFTPVTNIKEEAYAFITDKFRGNTIPETLERLSNYLTESSGIELTKEQLAEEINADLNTDKGKRQTIGHLNKALLDIVLDPRNAEKPIAQEFKDKYNPQITRLKYAEPYTEKGVEQPLHEQSLEVIHNKLIESYVAVLTSTNVVKSLMKPIDEPFIEDDIKNQDPEQPRKDMMDFDAYSDIGLKQDFKLGKAGLGQLVNSLTDSVLGSMGELSLIQTFVGRGNENVDNETRFDREYSEELKEADIEAYVTSFNELTTGEGTTYEEVAKLAKIKIDDSHKALANGFVDIAKDPFITRGNWVTQTNGVGMLLVRAGVHPFYINSFMGQPIIKEYVRFINNNESNLKNNNDNLKEQFLIKKVKEQFVKKMPKENIKIKNADIDPGFLIERAFTIKIARELEKGRKLDSRAISDKNIKTILSNIKRELGITLDSTFSVGTDTRLKDITEALEESVKEIYFPSLLEAPSDIPSEPLQASLHYLRAQKKDTNLEFQMKVLEKYLDLVPLGKNLNRSNKGSKATTDGKGKNITSLLIANNYIRDIIRGELDQDEGALAGFGSKLRSPRTKEDTFLNRMIKNSILTPYKIMRANPKFFLSAQDEFVDSFNYISYRLRGSTLQDQNLGDELEKAHQAYIMSGFAPLQMTGEERQKLLDEMPGVLTELKEDAVFKDNLLIQMLYNKDGTDRSYVAMPNSKKSTSLQNSLTDAWRQLLEEKPEIGEDLIRYAYTISGFNMSMNQFHDFIPYEWFNRHRFNAYIKDIARRSKTGSNDPTFIDQFFRHQYDTANAKRMFDERPNTIRNEKGDPIAVRDAFKITLMEKETPNHFVYIREEADSRDPLSNPENSYYTLTGWTKDEAFYVRTTPLGNMDREGNKIVEYNIDNQDKGGYAESLVHKLPKSVDQNAINYVMRTYNDARLPDHIMVTEENTKDVTRLLDAGHFPGREIIATVINPREDSKSTNKIEQFEPGRYVDYKGEQFVVTKRIDDNKIQIFNPNKKGTAAKKSVLESSIIRLDGKGSIITYKDIDYIVTKRKAIVSLATNQKMKWDDNHGYRKAILAMAESEEVHKQEAARKGNKQVVESKEIVEESNIQREYTPENITKLGENEIFVFGSNEGSSRGGKPTHGKGAAKVARDKFGAIQGQSRGLQGQSYAVVTKKYWDVKKSSTLDEIYDELVTFLEFAEENPNLKFYMTKIASSLGGYSVEEVAETFIQLYNDRGIPDNVILPKEYEMRDFKQTKESQDTSVDFNPTSISEAKREEYKKFTIDTLGEVMRVEEVDNGGFKIYFEAGNSPTVFPKQGQFTGLAEYQKKEGDDLKLFAGLSKIAEEYENADPTLRNFYDGRSDEEKNDPFQDKCPF